MAPRAPGTVPMPYGLDAAQHVSIEWPAPGITPRGITALIHGGYWRSHLHASLMDPLAASLRENGWVTANVEYRRGTTGPWPAPLDDVRTALALVSELKQAERIGGPLVAVGHSVGGQLALLTAPLVDAVVALAPVTDVERTYRERLGDDAAAEYFGVSPEDAPEAYRAASPMRQPLGNTQILVLHGINDDRVPLSHSRDFVAAANRQAARVSLVEYSHLGHLEAIDPLADHWPNALSWMSAASGPTPREPRSESA
ncbi:MAG: alpha/beta fold hydrolase [Paeniglutamicibacter sp.]|uniref:alpha/beta hydrolase family protein n=1 Tax=Arthrobacter sp. UCD-GKA TaxID=1913576 RepID=UPI0009F625DA|nr:alpha/beta fold hydrolase [Arthrobacter sp. UCD-GKA]